MEAQITPNAEINDNVTIPNENEGNENVINAAEEQQPSDAEAQTTTNTEEVNEPSNENSEEKDTQSKKEMEDNYSKKQEILSKFEEYLKLDDLSKLVPPCKE